MSFDFFLANLLFGMTLLTASMAAAHFIGDFLADGMRVSRRARMLLRIMTLLSCSLLSLLLFLVKLSGPDLNKAFAPGAGSFEPRLSKKVKMTSSEVKQNTTPTEATWTFVDTLSTETPSELKLQTEVLKKSKPWISLVNAQSPLECRQWKNQAQAFGLRLSDSSSIPSAADTRILICASEKHSSSTWAAARDLVGRGGSIFFVGRFVDADTSVLSQLLQIKAWRSPDMPNGSSFVFGGNLFGFGGFPAGLKITMPTSWSQGGQSVVGAEGDNKLVTDNKSRDENYTSFIVKSFSQGRVAWTSLPAQLSEKNKLLYGEYWNLAMARTFSYLSRRPSIGSRSLPSDVNAVVVPVVHAEYDFKNARDIQAQLEKLKLPASYYLVMSEALNDRKTVNRVGSQEVGASAFTHTSLDGADFFERVHQWYQWKKSSLNFDSLHDQSRGVLTLSGQDQPADTLAAAMANRFSYALGDPFNDYFSPRSFTLRKTEDIKNSIADKTFTQVKGGSDEVLVLPMATGNDFDFYQDGKLSSSTEIEQSLKQKNKLSNWVGAPFVMALHTQVLGSSKGLESVKKVFESMIADKAEFMTVQNYLTWWQGKSSLEMKLETVTEDEIKFRVVNVGTIKAVKTSLVNSEFETWTLIEEKSDTKVHRSGNQIAFDDLEPGESVAVVIKKRSL